MAIVNHLAPAPYSFSRNFIPLKFFGDSYLEQTGIKAVNRIYFTHTAVPDGTGIAITFGATSLTMTAKTAADDSGYQFPAGDGSFAYVESILEYFQGNAILSEHFDIEAEGVTIVFTSKKKSSGYDFAETSNAIFIVQNDTAGRKEIARPGFKIFFELYCQNADHSAYERIYNTGLDVQPNSSGLAEVDISECLNSYLEKDVLDVPDPGSTEALQCTRSCRKFYYTFAEAWGNPRVARRKYTSELYTVLSGGLSTKGFALSSVNWYITPDPLDPSQDKFLNRVSSHQNTRFDQPQFLYFFNSRTEVVARRCIKYYFGDGSSTNTLNLGSVLMPAFSKHATVLTPNVVFNQDDYPGKYLQRYEYWLEEEGGGRLSEVKTYWIDTTPKFYVRYFLSWSSWGTLDTRIWQGKATMSLALVQQEAQRIKRAGDDIRRGTSTIFDVSGNNKFKITTGHITREELIANRDFFFSAHKFRFSSGLLLPVKVTSKEIPELVDGETRFYQEFEYEYLFSDDVYTEGDVNEPGDGFAPGAMASRPNLPITTGFESFYRNYTVADYAGALVLAVGDQRKIIKVTADETDGGATNRYFYEGVEGTLDLIF